MAHVVSPSIKELELEDKELPVGKEESGVRVVLGSGAQVQAILMPTESRKVFITRPSENVDTQLIREKFEKFGDIRLLYPFTSNDKWGFLVFKTVEQARAAVAGTKDHVCDAGEAEFLSQVTHNAELRACLSWCRRPNRYHCYVDVDQEYHPRCLDKGFFQMGTCSVTIMNNDKRENGLYLRGLPVDVTEDDVRRALLRALGKAKDAEWIFGDIIIPRPRVGDTDDNELKRIEEEIKNTIKKRLNTSTVNVTVRKPDPKSVTFKADVFFSSRTEGFVVCRNLRDNFKLNTYQVKIEFTLQIAVHADVMKVCKEEYQATLQSLETDSVTVKKEDTRRGTHILTFTAPDVEDVMKARARLTDVFKGDEVVLPNLNRMFTPDGQKFLQETGREEGAFVSVDNRLRTISVHGTVDARNTVKKRIEEFLEIEQREIEGLPKDVVTLKGGDSPAGVLNALITTHGDDLHGLRDAAGLHSLVVDSIRHSLTLYGSQDSLQKATRLIQQLKVSMLATIKGEKEEVACVVCLCPVDVGALYRLQICAHPYCMDCLQSQVTIAISSRTAFPITCCHEGCGVPLAWRDLRNLSDAGYIALPDLTAAAITSYVRTHQDAARFCTTPDCPMVYRVTTEDQAAVFQCPECEVRTCTACHTHSHDGVTCAMLRVRKVDGLETEAWAREDPANRRACPKCGARIEKIEGCNRMICAACRTIFCWLCGAEFSSEEECHDHLFKEHRGLYTTQ